MANINQSDYHGDPRPPQVTNVAVGEDRDDVCLSSANGTIMETRLSLWNRSIYIPEF